MSAHPESHEHQCDCTPVGPRASEEYPFTIRHGAVTLYMTDENAKTLAGVLRWATERKLGGVGLTAGVFSKVEFVLGGETRVIYP